MQTPTQSFDHQRDACWLILPFFAVLLWSGISPHDRFTWFLEVAPALIGLAILAATWTRFRFTTMIYTLICLHAIILMIGGKYTYAEVPAFNWLRDHFGLARNYYDRVGHFAQGFVPALVAREVLIRLNVVRGRGWLNGIVLAICLAFSAVYELVEWAAAVLTGERADAFLGTQGDPWDTQWDMFMCSVGAILALLLLSRLHDATLRKMRPITP
jgi:putative membrane protein